MYQKGNKELCIIGLYLTDYHERFYLREISKLTKIPLKTIQNKIKELEKKKILISTMHGKNKYFMLNLNNILTKFYLLQAEIQKTLLFIQKYPLFKTFIKEIKTDIALIVFGSFARFSANKESDLDLLVISKEKVKLPFYLLPYKPHTINLSEELFLKTKETIIEEIKKNHIILNNHSLYINKMWDYYAK
ncbi:nucleotidyltransferase domain-containing protein [Candidatus Woesearchaeota archaeon]|nr:nucleotidyltransferase domain-containing protein [Candidatus Woesearchaeota archaeon]